VRASNGLAYIINPEEMQAVSIPISYVSRTGQLETVTFTCGITTPVSNATPRETIDEIKQEFGNEVANLVGWLTDISKPTDGNRRTRKNMDLQHTASAPPAAKSVKLADLCSNSRNIVQHDPNFARVYLREKAALMQVLKQGDPGLYAEAERILKDGMVKLGLEIK
jgi:(p)ppGpp synthase/HD superfamily hydrolase